MMPRFKYTAEHLKFLEEGFKEMRVPELTQAFNDRFGLDKSCNAIKATLQNHKFRCGRPVGVFKGERSMFSPGQRDFIQEQYQRFCLVDLTKAFNKTFGTTFAQSQFKSYLSNHGILSGRTGCFEKGSKSWNEGTKGLTGRNKTSFKKGSVPPNQRPLYSERICSKDGYVLIKVPEVNPHTGFPTRFVSKHTWIWKQAGRDIPPGHALIFIDGDKTNVVLDNLMCVSRALLLRLNKYKYSEAPAETKPTIMTLAKLDVSRFKIERSLEESSI